MTLSIPNDLKAKMSRFPNVDWAEVVRHAIWEKVRVLEQTQRLPKRQTFHALVRRSRRYATVRKLRKSTLTKALRTVRHEAPK